MTLRIQMKLIDDVFLLFLMESIIDTVYARFWLLTRGKNDLWITGLDATLGIVSWY